MLRSLNYLLNFKFQIVNQVELNPVQNTEKSEISTQKTISNYVLTKIICKKTFLFVIYDV